MEKMCAENGFKLYSPPLSLCGDNAAMIGSQAFYNYKAGILADENLNAYATMELGTRK
jgi:N6-L-threonylcarbamoyladenine synthase